MTNYAWIILEDAFADDGSTAVGISGPSTATDEQLKNAEAGYIFRMYDDDGNFCLRGRLWADDMDDPEEEPFYAPLRDYGEGGYGCTMIKWQNHPEWDCS